MDNKASEDTAMIELTREEMEELLTATKARVRMHGVSSKPHKVCVGILEKLTGAKFPPVAVKPRKVGGVYSEKFKEY
jgi:hypothetical protein